MGTKTGNKTAGMACCKRGQQRVCSMHAFNIERIYGRHVKDATQVHHARTYGKICVVALTLMSDESHVTSGMHRHIHTSRQPMSPLMLRNAVAMAASEGCKSAHQQCVVTLANRHDQRATLRCKIPLWKHLTDKQHTFSIFANSHSLLQSGQALLVLSHR